MSEESNLFESLVTEVTALRSRLQAAEARLAAQPSNAAQMALIDNIPDMAWLMDRNCRVIAANEALAQALGRPRQQILGKKDLELWPLPQAEKFHRDDLIVIETGEPLQTEQQVELSDGRVGWFETIKTPIRNERGEVIGVAGVAREITERKRAEAALHHRILTLTHPNRDVSALRFEDLFDVEEIQKIQDAFAAATGVASVITDLHGRPITRPSNFCRLCLNIIRKTEKGLANCMCSDIALGKLNPDGPIIQPCLSGGLWDGGTSICVGDRHIANWLIGQVLDETQNQAKMLQYGDEIGANMEDYRQALSEVTRMPHAQFEKVCHALFLIARQLSQLALQNVQQARAIAERRKAEAALIEADRRKDEFLAMLSHELRNPLAPIRNAVQILRLTGAGDPSTLRQREVIDRQVTHMARLLDDLLDVSRITRGKIRLKKELLDLREVVDRAIETMRVLMDGRRQTLIYARPDAPLWLAGDPTRLEQVMCNLLNNAIKYSEDGGKLWVGVAATEAADGSGRQAEVVVRDEGVGIAPEMLPQVFDIFAQASQSLDRSQGGLGLGLTLVQTLMHLHGGTAHAASDGLGKGSAFTLRLPLVLLERRALVSEAGARVCDAVASLIGDGGEPSRPRVLVVDDIVDTATSMAEVLSLWGYPVRTAYDGFKALEAAREFQPGVVLLDIGLPGMDGFEVARRLRQEVGLAGAILIALTGYGADEDRQRAQAAGFNHHFSKPMDLYQLKSVLEQGVAGLI